MDAATKLIRDGRPPSMPEAAERALVSVATAYRYFRTAEELWEDAALYSSAELIDSDEPPSRRPATTSKPAWR